MPVWRPCSTPMPSARINNDPNRPWLTGTDGAGVPYNCQFVPSGPNSCDTLQGYDRRYVTYGTFADLYPGDSQMPYKPLTLESAPRHGQHRVSR